MPVSFSFFTPSEQVGALQMPPVHTPLAHCDASVQGDPVAQFVTHAAVQVPLVQGEPLVQAVPQVPQLEGSAEVAVQNPEQDVPAQLSVSPGACILYSTSRLASAPVLLAQVEPVRNEACKEAPAAKVITMGPVSDQNWPGVSTRSWPLVPSVKRKTAAGQLDPVGVFAVAATRSMVIAWSRISLPPSQVPVRLPG